MGYLTLLMHGQKVPDVHRRLICQKVSVSRNLSQKVIPSDEDFSCLYPTFTSEVIIFRSKRTKVKPSTLDGNFFNSAVTLMVWSTLRKKRHSHKQRDDVFDDFLRRNF